MLSVDPGDSVAFSSPEAGWGIGPPSDDGGTRERLGVAGGETQALVWQLDVDAGTGRDQFGRTVALRPFLGVMGMPPPEPGVHGTHPPRRLAAAQAVDGMLELMHREHGFDRRDALALASVVVDLRVTQLVNGVKGVHAMLCDDALV